MTTSILTVLFAAFLVGSLLLRVWLASRQIRHVATHRHSVPAAFEATVSLQAHQRAADYTLAKLRLGLLTTAFGAAVLLGWTLLGGLDALNGWLLAEARPALGDLGYQLALLAAFALITGLIDLPFEAWTTFRLEQRHGFNHTTPGLWLADQAKGVLVGALLGLLLAGPLDLLNVGLAVAAFFGAAAGGLYGFLGGLLTGAGQADSKLKDLALALREGRVLVTTECEGQEKELKLEAIFRRHGAVAAHKGLV